MLPKRQDKLACRSAVQLLQRLIGVVDRFRRPRALVLVNRVIQRARALPPALQDQLDNSRQRAQIVVAVALQRLLGDLVHMLVLFGFVRELWGGFALFFGITVCYKRSQDMANVKKKKFITGPLKSS